MKRIFIIFLAAALALSLLACAPAAQDASVQEAEKAPKTKLTGLLKDLATDYHPGTAGCSLTAARLAGSLLDWYAEAQPLSEDVSSEAGAFFDSLDAEAAVAFRDEQLGDIYDTAGLLTGEEGADLLSSAGYTPAHAPWTQTSVTDLFTALYSGIGAAFPE